EKGILDIAGAPVFQFRCQFAIQRPTRRECEAALRVIGRTQAMKPPDISRQYAIREFVALAPPLIPDAADVVISPGLGTAEFGWKEVADSEQPRLNRQRFGPWSCPPRAKLRDPMHRPDIVFITERSE